MLTREDDIDVHALRRQGWTISAIARHLGKDRRTIRAYLSGREAGVRARSRADPFDPFAAYCAQRLTDDPHLWASALFDELLGLGYDRSYPTMTRQLRARGLRPACEPCRPTKDRAVAVIEHPPGAETQWDWVELPDPPEHWGWGKNAHLLVGALAHSGRWRGVLCESEDQPHLIDGLDRISHALGGLTRDWRFDRMATVVSPESGKVSASFSAVAKHYGVAVKPCPPRRGNRKGVVEKANHVAAQRFWRTLPDDVSVEQAQVLLDAWCTKRGDTRLRATADGKSSVATAPAYEPVPEVRSEVACPKGRMGRGFRCQCPKSRWLETQGCGGVVGPCLLDADVGAEGGQGAVAGLVGDGAVAGSAQVGVGDEPGAQAVRAVRARVHTGAGDGLLDQGVDGLRVQSAGPG